MLFTAVTATPTQVHTEITADIVLAHYYSVVRVRCDTYVFRRISAEGSQSFVFLFRTRHAAQPVARRPAEDGPPIGGVRRAAGAGNFVGDFEKIHSSRAEVRQGTSRVGELCAQS